MRLAAEVVEGATLALEGVDNVHGVHGLAASVLSVGDSVTDDVLEEDLEDRVGLFVDESRDTLHTATACETANDRLGDALDIVAEHLAVVLGTALGQTLAAFCHVRTCLICDESHKLPIMFYWQHSQKSQDRTIEFGSGPCAIGAAVIF